MKRIMNLAAVLSVLLAVCGYAFAQPSLRFNSDGTLKIVQFTDTHYKYGKKASHAATEMMDEVLEAENPDFVIITGDLVYSKGVREALPELVEPIVRRGLPWACLLYTSPSPRDS